MLPHLNGAPTALQVVSLPGGGFALIAAPQQHFQGGAQVVGSGGLASFSLGGGSGLELLLPPADGLYRHQGPLLELALPQAQPRISVLPATLPLAIPALATAPPQARPTSLTQEAPAPQEPKSPAAKRPKVESAPARRPPSRGAAGASRDGSASQESNDQSGDDLEVNEQADKSQLKREKNKLAQRRYRDRRRTLLSELEDQAAELEQKVADGELELQRLFEENRMLKARLEQQDGPSGEERSNSQREGRALQQAQQAAERELRDDAAAASLVAACQGLERLASGPVRAAVEAGTCPAS